MPFECIRCGYKCDSSVILKRHLNKKKLCNPILNDVNITDIDECKIEKFYKCDICNEIFTIKSNLNRHKNNKHDENSLEYLKQIVD